MGKPNHEKSGNRYELHLQLHSLPDHKSDLSSATGPIREGHAKPTRPSAGFVHKDVQGGLTGG